MKGRIIVLVLSFCFESALNAGSDEKGFVSLFDGTTLKGWVMAGQTGKGYYVEEGKIICAEGESGNLLTEKEYADFILRFEFKLAVGSNNGLAIRAPLLGSSLAYDGMELQIIDDNAEKYKGRLKPWQAHGSLYAVFSAKSGYLKPAGEWNEQEVMARGRQIQVILNGHTILDVNLEDVKDPEILKKHPGLKRPSGHLGFLGHRDYVEFRNIRIRELH